MRKVRGELQDIWLDERRAEEIARKVREELARRRISRQALADMARISISTLEKALSGRRAFTLATVIRLEEALGTPLRGGMTAPAVSNETASEELGGYSHAAVRWLEGDYLTLRPSFGQTGIYAFKTSIAWEPAMARLVFTEGERSDGYAQHGSVSLPHMSGHIYLVTAEGGQYRLAIFGRPTRNGTLYGVLTTLIFGHGSQLVPACCPIAMQRINGDMDSAFGVIGPDHPCHAAYQAELDAVRGRDFGRFPGLGLG